MKKMFLIGVMALTLGACSFTTFSQKLNVAANTVETYAPLVGKDLLDVAGIIVAAECSPAMNPVSQTASNILNIVAPNNSAASAVQGFLTTNQAVAAQLCPLVSAIKASVGAVPSGPISQTISVPPATQAALHWSKALARPTK